MAITVMKISVAICTWNRASLLDKTLATMRNMVVPQDVEWNLIVVNNNCTDNTDAVLENHASFLPIRRVFESKQGLSNARNAAVMAANGEYIIWTDDDVLVEKNWLVAYSEAFREYRDSVFFGGPVDPWFEGQAPSWITEGWRHVASAFATRDLGDDFFSLTVDKLPYGANYAVRLLEQKIFLYDPELGLSKNKVLLGEESAVMIQLLESGYSGCWIPFAKVRHWIPHSRQTIAYIRSYYMGYGRTLCRKSKDFPRRKFIKPFWLWKKALKFEFLYLYQKYFKSPEVWTKSLVEASVCWGMILE